MFFPKGTPRIAHQANTVLNRHLTSYPLKGRFLPIPTSFNCKSVWNLIREYLNPAINEMYTAIKFAPSGRVVPTLVVRQYPFSSPILHKVMKESVTAFHELPRWVADPVLVRGLDIGRGDGERINFVHTLVQPAKRTMVSEFARQIVDSPPISDPQDIKRHGLRPHMSTVMSGVVDDQQSSSNEWTTIQSDFLIGQHLVLSGVCSLYGITSPIVPGDNFELDNGLYHIESVNHHCEIQPNGMKTFTTQLSLSHGLRADVPKILSRIPVKRMRKKGHINESMLRVGDKLATIEENESEQERRDRILGLERYGRNAYIKALKEKQDGVEIDIVVGEQQNLDLFLYNAIDPLDEAEHDPGFFTDSETE